ncbi:hypothetical protein OH76DRAFT_194260 [Lentinus brumalis]|uniref:Uncharacterized protein n=1 Tax=Lentinus brumalis TaxID=2498619 RepID=A0A371DHX3_9APHY|nr:hypothetical protein OH76DRAFT_194260 [Polyporus brumalis]
MSISPVVAHRLITPPSSTARDNRRDNLRRRTRHRNSARTIHREVCTFMSSDCRISADASLISDSRAILSNKSRCPAFHPGRAVCARAVSHRPPSLLALPGSDPSGIEPGSGPARSFAMLVPLRPPGRDPKIEVRRYGCPRRDTRTSALHVGSDSPSR